ncbi:small subunit ribosomal protein S9, partial [Phenoliferia sp. Uapishka_3]
MSSGLTKGRSAGSAGLRQLQSSGNSSPSPSFFPSSPSTQSITRTTKPPSSLWYTARPSLNSTITSLDTSLTASRAHLFRSGLLPSIAAPINHEAEFYQVLPHPRIRRWKNSREMATYLKNGTDLRNSQYKRLTSLLSNLEGLLPYAQLADQLPSTSRIPNLEVDPVTKATSGRDVVVEKSEEDALQPQLEAILARFQQAPTFSATGIAIERIVGKDRRLGKKDQMGRVVAVGRRKESSARVWIIPVVVSSPDSSSSSSSSSTSPETIPGRVLVNTLPIPDYFTLPPHRASAIFPLRLTSTLGSFNVFAIAKGGGLAAQADAVAMATARALVEWERSEVEAGNLAEGTEEWRSVLKKAKLLERDPRMVERKKTGQPKARAKNTWVKR